MIDVRSPSMRKVAFVLAAFFLLASVFVVAGPAAAKNPDSSGVSIPVTGTLSDGGSFEGEILDPVVTADRSGNFFLSGTLEGTATTADGVTEQVSQEFTTSLVPSTGSAGGDACPILSLDVGAIFLDLLGLQVELSPINLDVTAVPGAGNLLGNLLCAVAGLLDNPGEPVNAIVELLNRLLSGLFG